ncbi:MAG: hypothetical protein ABH879_02135 [archaeon]
MKAIQFGCLFCVLLVSVIALEEPAPPSFRLDDEGNVEYIASCSNGLQDVNELEVDCGGPDCMPCKGSSILYWAMGLIVIIGIAAFFLMRKRQQPPMPQAYQAPPGQQR